MKPKLYYLCAILLKSYIKMDVKGIIKEKGYTMDAVAKEMGITRVTLSQNLARNPTVRTLKKIADVIGCRVGDFFKDELDTPTLKCPHCGKPIHVTLSE